MIVKAVDIQEMLTKKPSFNQKKEKKKKNLTKLSFAMIVI